MMEWLRNLLKPLKAEPEAPSKKRVSNKKGKGYSHQERQRNFKEQWKRIQRTKEGLPYLVLTFGPVEHQCPIHGDDYGLLLPVDHAYWKKYPPCQHTDCHCRIRQASHWEYERLLKNGIPAPATEATQEIDPKTGLPTGRHTGVRVPIKTHPARS